MYTTISDLKDLVARLEAESLWSLQIHENELDRASGILEQIKNDLDRRDRAVQLDLAMIGPKRDKYDDAIVFLTHHPELLRDTWNYAGQGVEEHPDNPGSCLFYPIVGPGPVSDPSVYACLTQLKYSYFSSPEACGVGVEFFHRVVSDDRIPESKDLKLEHLPLFAEYQREADRLRDQMRNDLVRLGG